MKLGALYIGKNIPEIKNKGSIDAFTIAGAASMLGISDVKAIARVENDCCTRYPGNYWDHNFYTMGIKIRLK